MYLGYNACMDLVVRAKDVVGQLDGAPVDVVPADHESVATVSDLLVRGCGFATAVGSVS